MRVHITMWTPNVVILLIAEIFFCRIHVTAQKKRGRRSVKRDRAKCYRDKNKIEKKLKIQIKLTNKYKQRLNRLQHNKQSQSPASKATRLLQSGDKAAVKKALTLHHAMMHTVKRKYKNTRSEHRKQLMTRFLVSKLIRKYRLQKHAQAAIGFCKKRWANITDDNDFAFSCRRKLSSEVRSSVRRYYLRDDVSHLTTGKKNTITREKKEHQRRLLTDSLKNLYEKFESEHHSSIKKVTY